MRDAYDLAHEETGSSNISKATPEWKDVLTKARATVRPGEQVLHIAYALASQEAIEGIPWSKCMNCGSPFRIVPGKSDGICSNECYDELIRAL